MKYLHVVRDVVDLRLRFLPELARSRILTSLAGVGEGPALRD
jgi:hypothetical protein